MTEKKEPVWIGLSRIMHHGRLLTFLSFLLCLLLSPGMQETLFGWPAQETQTTIRAGTAARGEKKGTSRETVDDCPATDRPWLPGEWGMESTFRNGVRCPDANLPDEEGKEVDQPRRLSLSTSVFVLSGGRLACCHDLLALRLSWIQD